MLTEHYYHLNKKSRLTAFEKSQPQIQPECLVYPSSPTQIHNPMDIYIYIYTRWIYCPILINLECEIQYSSVVLATFFLEIFSSLSAHLSLFPTHF